MPRIGFGLLLGFLVSLCGCNEQPPAPTPEANTAVAVKTQPHPPVMAPTFRVVHQAGTIVTLVVPERTTDDQVKDLLWLLRDRTMSSSLDSLRISQTLIDRRNPMVWFQIYRGSKCATENYSKVKPCGRDQHEAGWFAYGSYASPYSSGGEVYHGANETESETVWDATTPYSPKPYIHAPSLTLSGRNKQAAIGTPAELGTASDFNAQVWNGGKKAIFSVPSPSELLVQADWLDRYDERKLMADTMTLRSKELCAARFRKVHMTGFSDDVGSHIDLPCSNKNQ